jgi:DNA-binding NarL/FixJ family response regulator
MAIRVICVDDGPDILQMLRLLIDRQEDMCCVFWADNAQSLLDHLAGANAPGRDEPTVVLLDYVMPGLEPMKALEEITRSYSSVRVILCSGHDETLLSEDAIEAGAWGVVCKHNGLTAILQAVRRVARGEVALTQQVLAADNP